MSLHMKDMNTNFAQLDGQTVGKTNGRTDKVILIPPPLKKKFVCGGGGDIIKLYIIHYQSLTSRE